MLNIDLEERRRGAQDRGGRFEASVCAGAKLKQHVPPLDKGPLEQLFVIELSSAAVEQQRRFRLTDDIM